MELGIQFDMLRGQKMTHFVDELSKVEHKIVYCHRLKARHATFRNTVIARSHDRTRFHSYSMPHTEAHHNLEQLKICFSIAETFGKSEFLGHGEIFVTRATSPNFDCLK